MSVFLKIDIPRGQESNYFNRPKYLVYEDRSLYETDFSVRLRELDGLPSHENFVVVKYLNTPV